MWEFLPRDMVNVIFKFVEPFDWPNVRLACKSWSKCDFDKKLARLETTNYKKQKKEVIQRRGRGLVQNVKVLSSELVGDMICYTIRGQTGTYLVTYHKYGNTTCGCPDASKTGVRKCKHQYFIIEKHLNCDDTRFRWEYAIEKCDPVVKKVE